MSVGRYVLLRELARGGMAEIWLAHQSGAHDFHREFVIKRILSVSDMASPEFNQMFIDEARISAQLQHANVVQVFELGLNNGSPYMVMEYLPGESLSRLARALARNQERLPIPLALFIIGQAADGLGYAHRKTSLEGDALQIVHRDVSPQNLFVTYEGAVKVLDFGIAKATGRLTRTATGVLKGKVAYMSPEQALGRPVSASTDVFALGVVLFELLTGTRLYGERDDLSVIQALAADEPRPLPSQLRADIPREVDALVESALRTDASQRPADGVAFKEELDDCMRAMGARASTEQLRQLMRTVFAEHIQKLGDFLASARAGVIPETATPSQKGPTMPGRTPGPQQKHDAAPPRRMLALLGLGLAAAVGLGAALLLVPARQSTVVIVSDPADATISVDGAPASPAPVLLKLRPGPHGVVASKPGFVTAVRSIEVVGDDRVVLTLLAEPTPPRPSPPPEPAPRPPPAVAATEPEHAPVKPVRKATAAATMRLNLETRPWTRVYLGRQLLGDTPLVDVAVPAGELKLRLVNDEQHIDTTVELSGRAGEQLYKNLSF